jgi:hypothetical protein
VNQTFTDVEVIIGANHEIFAYDWFNYQTAYWGSLNMATDSATGTLFAEVWDPIGTFPDGNSFGTVNVTVDVRAKQDVIGTYTGVGDVGTIQVQYDSALAERPSSLSDISGTWFFSDGFGYTAVLTVSASGDLDYSDTDGWVGLGQIQALDPDLNGYSFQWDWTHPDPANAGPTGGIAYLNDRVFGEHQLVFAEWWDAVPGGYDAGGDIWHMPRPAPSAVINSNDAVLKTTASVARSRTAGKRRQFRSQ